MKKMSKMLCLLLVVFTLFSTTAILSSARTSYNLRRSYSSYTTVKLRNRRKCAYIYVHNSDKVYGSNNYHYVKLTDGNGRYLWEGRMGSNSNYQRMYLGNDHSSYRIYVRSAHNSGSVSVTSKSNARVS